MVKEIESRHSVRVYQKREVEAEVVKQLKNECERCNKEGKLNIQIVLNESKAFSGFFVTFGRFKNVMNYFALVGEDDETLDERAGYYGEQLVLYAQKLGLNTCWVSGSFNKKKNGVKLGKNQRLVCLIAFGYGETQGRPHKSKPIEELYQADIPVPDWFQQGMKAAALAPTAMNKQNFCIALKNDKVTVESTVKPNGMIDVGIVKCNFELGSGKKIVG
ncbi:MAG: nitroreductase family protein [Clostridiales bacterium]|nr:nitroreductase family protein [Clostridiales bacterium]